MKIREVQTEDFHEWLRMRRALWPEHTLKQLFSEMIVIFKGGRFSNELEWAVFVIEKENGLGGFIEVSIHSKAEQCETMPVGFIEGWWIDPDYRKQGLEGKLVERAEKWALSKGCKEMASETDEYREISLIAYPALGYEVTSRGKIIKFKKNIREKE